MDTDTFIAYIKTDVIYKDIAEDVERIFDASSNELERPLPKGKKTKKLIGLMKDELSEKILTKLVGLRAKSYSYLIDDSSENKKGRGSKKVCHKKKT